MKGVSSLIASVLLILIVVTLAGLLVSYVTSFVKGSTATIENRTDTTIDCAGAAILIDEVYLSVNNASSSARVRVLNTGSKDGLIITSGVFFNSSGINFSADNLPVRGFNVGDIEIVRFSNISVYACKDFSQLTIGTSCGVASDTFSKTPKCS